jgi:hypothetical protein
MADSTSFVGTWRLLSWEAREPDGAIRHVYGRNPVGYLIYTADGYVSAEIMDPDRRQSDPHFPLEPADAQSLPDADRARAYSTYVSYCGTYAVEEGTEEGTLVHHVEAGLVRDVKYVGPVTRWRGSDQRRHFRFDDGRLILRAGRHELTWERAVNHA